MANTDTTPQMEALGRRRDRVDLQSYESPKAYTDQGDMRVIKDLQFVFHVVDQSPMLPNEEVVREQSAARGEVVYTDEIGLKRLALGEKLGSFFTTEELAKLRPEQMRTIWNHGIPPEEIKSFVGTQAVVPATGEGAELPFSQMGTHELADYIEQNKPNVNETIAMADNDPEAAKRVLEAESIATDNDPRKGVIDGLTSIIGEADAR